MPAHIWTPWFSALGSKSGFDAIADCYADLAEHIFAVETGLSSDPAMNWRVSTLDRYRLVSNSDAHSPPALAREATVLDTELDYAGVRAALETGDGLAGTIEFFPEEGKYHADGHRGCGVQLEPAQTRAPGGRCPECGKPLTVGVLHRVEELADRAAGVVPAGAPPWFCFVQLPQVLGEIQGVGPRTKTVEAEVSRLVARSARSWWSCRTCRWTTWRPRARRRWPRRSAGCGAARWCWPGYDGEYGVIRLFEPEELAELRPGTGGDALFELPSPPPPPPPPPPIGEERAGDTPEAAGPSLKIGAEGPGDGLFEMAALPWRRRRRWPTRGCSTGWTRCSGPRPRRPARCWWSPAPAPARPGR